MNSFFKKYTLKFKRPSGTSRGVMLEKETYFIIITEDNKVGIGECGILKGLSFDDRPDYEKKLQWVCENIHLGEEQLWGELMEYPSIQFGIEQVFLSLKSKNPFVLFPSRFTEGQQALSINGLVWMGTADFMREQIKEKIASGFHCIKLKIGAIHFDDEYKILENIRKDFSPEQIEIRVDANGGFKNEEALEKLQKLSQLQLHSIEQPIKPKSLEKMKELCAETPLPIALDEELIGCVGYDNKFELLNVIRPQYIILKPSLIGGFRGCKEWIAIAEQLRIGWWITSALESNIGLNAIAQWTYTLENRLPQGLGTGSLYTNNINSPLTVKNGYLWYDTDKNWDDLPAFIKKS